MLFPERCRNVACSVLSNETSIGRLEHCHPEPEAKDLAGSRAVPGSSFTKSSSCEILRRGLLRMTYQETGLPPNRSPLNSPAASLDMSS